MSRKQKKMLFRIVLSSILLFVLLLLPTEGWVRAVLFWIPYFVIGYDILIKAVKGIFHGQPFDENFLMAVATVGAMVLGEYTEGVAVMLFYQVGEWFQSYAVGKSRRSIGALMDIRPDIANVLMPDGTVKAVDPDEVEVGSVLVVRPGEKIPIDGIVIQGATNLDTHSLTGESMPRAIQTGDEVISGCISLTGLLHIRTTRPFEESTVSKILELVEHASSQKSRSEQFISRFARVYTPVVCLSALSLAFLPPLVRTLFLSMAPMWSEWILRALTFLVISCPCALVISIPLSFFAGIGGASREGILIKGSNYLESLASVRVVAFDKTGTVTTGSFEVERVDAMHGTKEELLNLAALAESHSNHPIAESLRRAVKVPLDTCRLQNVNEKSGYGVTATVDGHTVAVGNAKLMKEYGIDQPDFDEAGSVVHVASDGTYLGSILVADRIKDEAAQAIKDLGRTGIRRTVMLTGDRYRTGACVAQSLGIDEVQAELLPNEKLFHVEALLATLKKGERLAFVGDGINDAPVLMRADVGIAMGALGADAAIEASDIVLMDDDPKKIAKAIRASRKCMRIVRQNIIFALGIKALCLILGALGYAGMWVAVFADVGVMILAVLNAFRAMRID